MYCTVGYGTDCILGDVSELGMMRRVGGYGDGGILVTTKVGYTVACLNICAIWVYVFDVGRPYVDVGIFLGILEDDK